MPVIIVRGEVTDMNTGKLLLTGLGLWLCSTAVNAADCIDGLNQYMSGDAKKALSTFTALAKKGDGCAQFQIGMMHFFGHGTAQNETEARNWISKSAKSGFKKAEEALTRWEEMKQRPDLTSGA